MILNLFNLISYFFFRSIEVQGDGKEGNKDLKLLKTLQKPNGVLFEQNFLIAAVWDNKNKFVWFELQIVIKDICLVLLQVQNVFVPVQIFRASFFLLRVN